MNRISARILSLALFSLVWPSLALADQPVAGDLIYFDGGSCSLFHLNPSTGVNGLISRWDCFGGTGTTVGVGPTNWAPSDVGEIFTSPDGWIYVKGFGTQCCGPPRLYRIDPATGDREFVVVIPESSPDGSFGFFLWPSPGFFTPTVAALSTGAVALLVGLLGGTAIKRGKTEHLGK